MYQQHQVYLYQIRVSVHNAGITVVPGTPSDHRSKSGFNRNRLGCFDIRINQSSSNDD